ncbi:hypothetical protein R1flu_023916 [Riccia fluitans]|uniref:Uncharacterized protein n=1 Tax=Riccia fluitans TaxID=41844 RepID=A0ABD1XTV5_9MARC
MGPRSPCQWQARDSISPASPGSAPHGVVTTVGSRLLIDPSGRSYSPTSGSGLLDTPAMGFKVRLLQLGARSVGTAFRLRLAGFPQKPNPDLRSNPKQKTYFGVGKGSSPIVFRICINPGGDFFHLHYLLNHSMGPSSLQKVRTP